MLWGLRTYPVLATARRPLINFMLNALKDRGCRIIHASTPNRAPFVFTFELSTLMGWAALLKGVTLLLVPSERIADAHKGVGFERFFPP
jgi:hypothetical protein